MKISEFFSQALTESGGVSFGRLASMFVLMNVLAWDAAYIVFAMHRLGDFSHMGIADVLPSNAALLSQGAFASLFYGINKAKSAIDNSQSCPTK